MKVLKDGEAISVNLRKEYWRIQCCDCGLTHDADIVVNGDVVTMKLWRNRRCTAQRRRRMGEKGEKRGDSPAKD